VTWMGSIKQGKVDLISSKSLNAAKALDLHR
jgi:hypothetical protein